MLYFNNLNKLSQHHEYLTSIFGQKQFFFVGGMIRDLLLGRETNMDDVDITLTGTHTENKKIIQHSDQDFSFFDTEKYGTMTIIPKIEGNKSQYEVTPFRTETNYSDGRHPDEVIWSDSLLDDSQRRDFTINCLYYINLASTYKESTIHTKTMEDNDLMIKTLEKTGFYKDNNSSTLIIQNHELIQEFQNDNATLLKKLGLGNVIHVILDPHGGIQDLLIQKIRAVGDADRRFQEDSLRVIRALRFMITLEFDIEKSTWTSLQKNAYLIRKVAKERIKQETDKVFASHNPFGFIALLDEANLLKWIFPKLYDNKGVDQPIRYHPFDVYTHSMMVLYHLQELSTDVLLRYAALYHDVGKVEQYSSYKMKLDESGLRSLFGSRLNHVICGEEFSREDFSALGASKKEIDTIARYVRHHMIPGDIARSNPDHYHKKLRALIADVGPDMVKNLCILTIADIRGQYNPIQKANFSSIHRLIEIVDEIMEDEGRFSMKDLAIDGDILMKEFKLTPGPILGKLLKKSYERVLDDLVRNKKERLFVQIKVWLKEMK